MTQQMPVKAQGEPTKELQQKAAVDRFNATLHQMQNEIARALPKHMTGDRFVRIVLTEVRKNPTLALCDPLTMFGSLLTAAALGLEPGLNGECWLVPRKNHGTLEAQLQIGYQGVVKLFWQNPAATYLDTGYVCERDEFRFAKGLNPILEHTPAEGDRGKVVRYYAVAGLNTGARVFDVFTPAQIKTLRGGKVGSNGDIPDPEHWMERKTALLQVLKLMPKSTQLAAVPAADGRAHTISDAQQIFGGVDTSTGEVLDAGWHQDGPVEP